MVAPEGEIKAEAVEQLIKVKNNFAALVAWRGISVGLYQIGGKILFDHGRAGP